MKKVLAFLFLLLILIFPFKIRADEILNNYVVTKRVHVKVCRKCGKMELYVDFNSSEVL